MQLISIERLPKDVQGKVTEYAGKLLNIHGQNIKSMSVYGSATGPNYIHGVSDVNIAVVFKALAPETFHNSLKLVSHGIKHKIMAPLFLTKEYIRRSSDVFPIEFSEIKNNHICIAGEDVFATLDIKPTHVRLLCEAQVKGKLLRVRQAYLESGGNAKIIRNILKDSLNSLFPVFRQLICLTGGNPSESKEELLKQLAAQFKLDPRVLVAIYQDKALVISLKPSRLEDHLNSYLALLEQLAICIDLL